MGVSSDFCQPFFFEDYNSSKKVSLNSFFYFVIIIIGTMYICSMYVPVLYLVCWYIEGEEKKSTLGQISK